MHNKIRHNGYLRLTPCLVYMGRLLLMSWGKAQQWLSDAVNIHISYSLVSIKWRHAGWACDTQEE